MSNVDFVVLAVLSVYLTRVWVHFMRRIDRMEKEINDLKTWISAKVDNQ